jgi:uncharacterized protein with HEPN domain
MKERDKARLKDMLDAAHKAQKFVENKTQAMLEENDEQLGFAVVRAIEIIGEAASKITIETRNAGTQIEWQNIIGMRNKVVHDYLSVDYAVVWQVVTVNLPKLIVELEKLLAE